MFGNKRHISTLRGINRNIVECKLGRVQLHIRYYSELIETLWNVNIVGNPTVTVASGINRNIVECKYYGYPVHSIDGHWN